MDVSAVSTSLLSAISDALWQPPAQDDSSGGNSLFGPSSILSLSGSADSASTAPAPIDLSALTSAIAAPVGPPAYNLTDADLAQLNSARALRDAGQYDDARATLNALLSAHPNNGFAAHAMGTVAIAEHDYAAAQRWFQRADFYAPDHGYDQNADTARVLQQDDATVLATAKRMLSVSDTASEGEALLTELTSRSPDNTAAHMLLADRLIKDGDPTNGLLQYRAAIGTANPDELHQIETTLTGLAKSSPTAAYVRQLLGRAQTALGEFDQAKQTLTEASNLANGDASYQNAIAQAYLASGKALLADHQFDGALSEFNQAAGLDPDSKDIKQSLAAAYQARGEHQQELGDLNGAITNFQSAQSQLNSAGTVAQKTALAADFYRVGRSVEARHLESNTNVGREAIAFQAAYDLSPTNQTYKGQLATVRERAGDQFTAANDLADAAGAYRRAYFLRRSDNGYRDNLIGALNGLGDQQLTALKYTDAVNAFKESYSYDQTNGASKGKLANAYNARGLDYLAKGDLNDAMADFKSALDLFPDNSDYQNNYNNAGGH